MEEYPRRAVDQSQKRYRVMDGEFPLAMRGVRLLWPSDLAEASIYRSLVTVGERLDRTMMMM